MTRRALVFIFTLLMASPVTAQIETVRFENTAQESLYHALLAELRCLVCANQSLSDSNADLAKDLRGKVYEMVTGGRNREQIADYMVARYGEYVLYRPRLSAATFFLWLAPFFVAAAGVLLIIAIAKRKPPPPSRSPEQLQKARALLEDERHW